MDLFTAEDLEGLLSDLDAELFNSCSDKRYEIYLVGGGALMLAWGSRRSTSDLDVVFKNDTEFIHKCVRGVASKRGVSAGWCNDAVVISTSFTPAILVYSTLWRSFKCLDVYTADLELLFCMKLIAGREKDIRDLAYIIERINNKGSLVTRRAVASWYKKYYVDFGKTKKLSALAKAFLGGLP